MPWLAFLIFLTNTKGKENSDTVTLNTNPNKKNTTERIPEIIHKASLTVNSHNIPSNESSKIKPNGHLNERQNHAITSLMNPSQIH